MRDVTLQHEKQPTELLVCRLIPLVVTSLCAIQARLAEIEARQAAQMEFMRLQTLDNEEVRAFFEKMSPWSACSDLSCPLCVLATLSKAEPQGVLDALDLGFDPQGCLCGEGIPPLVKELITGPLLQVSPAP